MRVLVVLPTYNESATIERVIRAVRLSLPGADILVVDDLSPDGTAKLAEEAGTERRRLGVTDPSCPRRAPEPAGGPLAPCRDA